MTDGEPEPFRMSTDPDDDPDESGRPEDTAADSAPTLDVESITDLIDEAERTADEQARQQAAGTAPADRSGDVWGDPDDDEEDLDAVWSAAAERHRGSHVFDDVLGTEDTWRSATRIPPAAADPTVAPGDGADTPSAPGQDEPEVFTLHVAQESAGDQVTEAEDGPGTVDDPDDVWGHTDDPDDGPGTVDDPDNVWGPADLDDDDVWREVDDVWGEVDVEDAGEASDEDAEEPAPFRFEAGPATSTPAAVPDHVEAADGGEPDHFAFAFDGDDDASAPADGRTDAPDLSTAPGQTDEPGLTDRLDPADEADDGDDDMVWSSPPVAQEREDRAMTTEPEPDVEDTDVEDTNIEDWALDTDDPADEYEPDDVDDRVGDGDEGPTLAESARPRADRGWHDQSADDDVWVLDDVTVQVGDVVELRDDDDEAEAPISTREPDPPFEVGSTALGDVLDDLLGDLDAPLRSPRADDGAPSDDAPAPAAPTPAAPTAHDAPTGDAWAVDPSDDDTPTGEDAAPTMPPSLDPPPPPVVDQVEDDHHDQDVEDPATAGDDPADTPDDTPVAAEPEEEQGDEEEPVTPAAPGGLSFSSAPTSKKRGLFGR